MRKAWFLAAALALVGAPALAADPTGNWLVKDQTAVIRIAPCADALCGTIAWTSQPGLDENNPDPSKRNRPIVGTQILLGMKPAGGTGGTGGTGGGRRRGASSSHHRLDVAGDVDAHDQRIHRRQLARHVDDAQLPAAVARDEQDDVRRPRRRAVDGQGAERLEGEGLLAGGKRRDEGERGERGDQADGNGFHPG